MSEDGTTDVWIVWRKWLEMPTMEVATLVKETESTIRIKDKDGGGDLLISKSKRGFHWYSTKNAAMKAAVFMIRQTLEGIERDAAICRELLKATEFRLEGFLLGNRESQRQIIEDATGALEPSQG